MTNPFEGLNVVVSRLPTWALTHRQTNSAVTVEVNFFIYIVSLDISTGILILE
jgi:hypothetical protein